MPIFGGKESRELTADKLKLGDRIKFVGVTYGHKGFWLVERVARGPLGEDEKSRVHYVGEGAEDGRPELQVELTEEGKNEEERLLRELTRQREADIESTGSFNRQLSRSYQAGLRSDASYGPAWGERSMNPAPASSGLDWRQREWVDPRVIPTEKSMFRVEEIVPAEDDTKGDVVIVSPENLEFKILTGCQEWQRNVYTKPASHVQTLNGKPLDTGFRSMRIALGEGDLAKFEKKRKLF